MINRNPIVNFLNFMTNISRGIERGAQGLQTVLKTIDTALKCFSNLEKFFTRKLEFFLKKDLLPAIKEQEEEMKKA